MSDKFHKNELEVTGFDPKTTARAPLSHIVIFCHVRPELMSNMTSL
jgi:hypothetical protein